MSLRQFMDTIPKGEKGNVIEKIAKSAGVAPSTVRHWICGLRNPKPENLLAINQVTGLSFQELRPDLYSILKLEIAIEEYDDIYNGSISSIQS